MTTSWNSITNPMVTSFHQKPTPTKTDARTPPRSRNQFSRWHNQPHSLMASSKLPRGNQILISPLLLSPSFPFNHQPIAAYCGVKRFWRHTVKRHFVSCSPDCSTNKTAKTRCFFTSWWQRVDCQSPTYPKNMSHLNEVLATAIPFSAFVSYSHNSMPEINEDICTQVVLSLQLNTLVATTVIAYTLPVHMQTQQFLILSFWLKQARWYNSSA